MIIASEKDDHLIKEFVTENMREFYIFGIVICLKFGHVGAKLQVIYILGGKNI